MWTSYWTSFEYWGRHFALQWQLVSPYQRISKEKKMDRQIFDFGIGIFKVQGRKYYSILICWLRSYPFGWELSIISFVIFKTYFRFSNSFHCLDLIGFNYMMNKCWTWRQPTELSSIREVVTRWQKRKKWYFPASLIFFSIKYCCLCMLHDTYSWKLYMHTPAKQWILNPLEFNKQKGALWLC